jgi:hypothetical protein
LKARAEISRDGTKAEAKPVALIDLLPVESRPLVHEGRLVSLPAGEYRVKLTAENAELSGEEISAPLYVHERLTPELSDVSSNRELLTQLADASGGRLILPDEVHQIPALFSAAVAPETQHPEIPLWDHWAILIIFFALMTTEWFVRKLNGLP